MTRAPTGDRIRAPRWPLLFIFAAACAFCWPVFAGKIMSPADMCLLMLPWKSLQGQFPEFHRAYNPMLDPIQQYLPWRIYAVDSLRSGVIPLWNPYSFCGTPFLANLQSTVLYPPNLLFLLTGARHGFGVSTILHLTLGGWFMYWFLLDLRLRYRAALFGALVFMFNGFTVTWLEYPTLSLWVLMWLPAILLCYHRSLERPLSGWPALTAAALGMQFLGGHLQISAYLVMALLLFALVRMATPGQTWRQRGLAALLALLPLALGMALAAGQILPTLELAEHTGRVSHGTEGALSTAFPLTHLVVYFLPNFFGNPAHYNYWGSYQNSSINFFETACYVGILPLFLAAWSLRRWRDQTFWFFAALGALAVLAAVGSPVYLAVYHLAPGFKQLLGLGRILCLAAFGLAGLAAMGAAELAAHREISKLGGCILGFASAAVVLALASLYVSEAAINEMGARFGAYLVTQVVVLVVLVAASLVLIQARTRLQISPGAFSALAIGLLLADLCWFGIRFNPFTDPRMAYPETETTRWLQQHTGHDRVTSLASDGMDWMAHNSSMIFGLRDIHGSDSLRVKRSFDLVSPPDGKQAKYPPAESPVLVNLGVGYLVTNQPLSAEWRLAYYGGETPVYKNGSSGSRLHLVQQVVSATDEEALAGVGSDKEILRGVAFAAPEVARQLQEEVGAHGHAPLQSPATRPHSRASFERDDPGFIKLKARAVSDGVLVLTDSYYPGWQAWVDGEETPIYRVNYGFRGVVVPEGEHTVEFRYQPASFRVGLFISLLALAVLLSWACASFLASAARARPTAALS